MTQKFKRSAKAVVEARHMKASSIENFVELFKKKRNIRITSYTVKNVGPNKNNILMDIDYDPVWGCQPYDIRKHVRDVLKKVTSAPELELLSFVPTVVAYRDANGKEILVNK